MSRLSRAIELAANLGIIISSSALCILVVFVFVKGRRSEPPRPIMTGERLQIHGVDWHLHKKTYVLAMQIDCHFCTDSAPEFQLIANNARKHKDVGIVAVLPQGEKATRAYLTKLGLDIPFQQMDLSLLRVQGTPTTLMCDSLGTVRGVWRGALTLEGTKGILGTMD